VSTRVVVVPWRPSTGWKLSSLHGQIGELGDDLPDNLPDKASPGETGSASRVTQTEIVYKVTHLYNVFPIAA